jgi:hypothetical protein
MGRLTTRWRGKLEAEAAAAEYESRRNVGARHLAKLQINQSTADTWDEFYQTFKALSDEEVQVALNNPGDRLLRAYVDYHDPKVKYGDSQLGGGITETFKARFMVAAMSAGRTLAGSNLSGPPLNVWLYHLFQNLVQSKSDLLFAPSKSGAIINRVCEASALCCLRLQAQALETDRPSAEEGLAWQEAAVPRSRSGPAPLRSDDFIHFAGRLWTEVKGNSVRLDDRGLEEIASRLDAKKYVPPTAYLEGKVAKELKAYNSKNANSKSGPIMTWRRLLQFGDKDQVRGMRRMLSRCAARIK